MSYIDKVKERLKEYSRRFWIAIWSNFDDRFKRMCVMASLHAALLECTDDEQKKIDRLNSKMQLVRDVNALRLPTLFGPRMWKGILPIDKIDLTNDAYLMRIVRKTPCWLLYTDEETFIQELKQLFYFCAWEKKQAV